MWQNFKYEALCYCETVDRYFIWKASDPCYAKHLVTLSPRIYWNTVHMPIEPLVLEEVVRKGANVSGYNLLFTFSKIL